MTVILSIRVQAFVIAVLAMNVAGAQTLDRVKMTDGRSSRGTVVRMSSTQVVVERGTGRDETISVNRIDTIIYAGEPRLLAQARVHVGHQRYEDALAALDVMNEEEADREFIKQDLHFYRALCQARLAISGREKLSTAGSAMHRFLSDSSNHDSYHYFEASEVLGELLAASGRHPKAIEYFHRLTETPWTEYQMRGHRLSARALMAQGMHGDAIRRLDQVLAVDDEGAEADEQRLAARLDKAICLSEMDKADEGIQIVSGVLAQAGPDDRELLAAIYRARGLCYLKAGQKKDALFDFLHIDLLYNGSAEIHAEALYRLSKLWLAVGKRGRAREAKTRLKERYPNSRWVTGGG